MRTSGRCFLFAGLLTFGACIASAQSSVDIGLGFGTAFDKASTVNGIDTTTGYSCGLNSGDATCEATSSMNGFFLGFGGDIMLYKKFGVGAEFNVEPARKNYGPFTDRQMFYDFNGVYQPYASKRAQLRVEGGVGGARTSLSYSQSSCAGPACSTQVEPVGTDSHFQVHVGVGVQILLTEHLFIRPQFDFHYVPNLKNDFNSDAVPEATVWVGYNFGSR